MSATAANPAVPSFTLDNRVAVVTGGASGIGRAAALALANFGARVGVLDRDEKNATAVVQEITAAGGTARGYPADVTREPEVEQAMGAAAKELDGIDIVVNSAGLAIRAPAVDLPLADWDKVIAVNLTGVFLCARHAARHMIRQERGGSIITIASIMGFSGGGLYPNISYQSSKGGVVNLTRALAVEWAPHRIRVNAVAPTWVNTPFIGPLVEQPHLMERVKAVTPLARVAEPGDITGAIVYLASPAAAMVTGVTLPVDGGFLAQ